LALKVTEDPDLREPGTFSMRGHSIGGFGSVTTNKVIATSAATCLAKTCRRIPSTARKRKVCHHVLFEHRDDHIYLHSELEYVDLVVLNDTTACSAATH